MRLAVPFFVWAFTLFVTSCGGTSPTSTDHGLAFEPIDDPILGRNARRQRSTGLIWGDALPEARVHSKEYMRSAGTPLPEGELGAIEQCASIGTRLPSARELAQLSQDLGAAGIRETAYANIDSENEEVVREININEAQGFYPILQRLADGGARVDFYFRAHGYKPREDLVPNLTRRLYWSSSLDATFDDSAYIFDGALGAVRFELFRWVYASVRCVR